MAAIVDIEALVIWAFRDQKADLVVGRGAGLHEIEASADGRPRQGGSNVASLAQYAALGTKIDEPGPDPGLVDPDAERIYEAVLTLNTACKGLVCRHGRNASRPDYGAGLEGQAALRSQRLAGKRGGPHDLRSQPAPDRLPDLSGYHRDRRRRRARHSDRCNGRRAI